MRFYFLNLCFYPYGWYTLRDTHRTAELVRWGWRWPVQGHFSPCWVLRGWGLAGDPVQPTLVALHRSARHAPHLPSSPGHLLLPFCWHPTSQEQRNESQLALDEESLPDQSKVDLLTDFNCCHV